MPIRTGPNLGHRFFCGVKLRNSLNISLITNGLHVSCSLVMCFNLSERKFHIVLKQVSFCLKYLSGRYLPGY